MSKKSLISGIFFFLLLLLAGNASSEVDPIYAGWTVGDSWGGYGTILRSADSGNTWTRQGEGQIADAGLWGVFAVDPYTAWVVGDSDDGYGTIYHTTDGGSTWERKGSPNLASADYIPDVNLSKVHVVGDHVWVVGASGDGKLSVILHTRDGGATWMNHMPFEYENIGLQGLYVLDRETVLVGGGTRTMGIPEMYGIILKTTDAGLTWTNHIIDDDEGASAILGISAADADVAWAVGGEGYVVVKTTDGGATWTRQGEKYFGGFRDSNEVYAVNASTVWVAADSDIFWTTDGGETWKVGSDYGLSSSLAIMGISAVSADEAWASHAFYGGGIYHTTDGGTTWTIIDQLNGEELPGLWTISFATQPINPDHLIISLIEDVELLVDDGLLTKGQGNALIVKLEHVLNRLVDDRLKAAFNALNAFSNQVDAFVRGGVLPTESGQDLSEQVNYIIELLSFPL